MENETPPGLVVCHFIHGKQSIRGGGRCALPFTGKLGPFAIDSHALPVATTQTTRPCCLYIHTHACQHCKYSLASCQSSSSSIPFLLQLFAVPHEEGRANPCWRSRARAWSIGRPAGSPLHVCMVDRSTCAPSPSWILAPSIHLGSNAP